MVEATVEQNETTRNNRVKTIGKIYRFLQQARVKEVVVYGGAGSGKSYTVAQFLIIDKLLSQRNKYLLIARKYNPSLRLTSYRLVLDVLNKLNVPYLEHKVEQTIELPRRNVIFFRGIDEPEKIKSAEFNYIWMEEATEFEYNDYLQLKLRLRRATETKNQMFLTYNSLDGWTKKQFYDRVDSDVEVLHTWYVDNPFLDEEYIQTLEKLIEQDEAFYRIYALGEYAEIKNKIYSNYTITNEVPTAFDEIIYGLDFGYNNPTACLRIGLKDGNIYILDELYERYKTNQELIEMLRDFITEQTAPVYCDSAEPQRIQELIQAGYYAMPSDKSVKDGIDFIKRHKIYISENCTNTIKEIESYKWREDKEGNLLEEPVKFMDHTMDALRYAVYTHMYHAGTKIFDKQEWGVF
ncbi:MAG TPA: PBSX family phage terminase large subunit [Spirochaetales bacterium]|nr:PBSX family phage terminase large subunit [Spirochaetales bacterium]